MTNKVVKKKKKIKKSIKAERTIIFIMLAIFAAIPTCNVYTKARLSETNIALEEVKNDIKDQERINESLKMEISELASLDTIQEVADAHGLTYQNGNIKVVTNE